MWFPHFIWIYLLNINSLEQTCPPVVGSKLQVLCKNGKAMFLVTPYSSGCCFSGGKLKTVLHLQKKKILTC